jgi:copper resistance protein C
MTITTLGGIAVAAIALALPLLPSTAWAHADLQTAGPAVYTNGVSPAELRLDFSEAVELVFTSVTLTGEGGAAIETGGPTLDPGDATVVIVPLTAALPAGEVKVEWKAAGADGHKSEGSFSFTVAP